MMSSVSASLPAVMTQLQIVDFRRHCGDFRPSIWGDRFLPYAAESFEVDEDMKQQVQIKKEELKKMFRSLNNHNISQKLNFIDSIQRLGISYHFEHEINEALEQIYNNYINNKNIMEEGSLHLLAVLFRLLRQKGYRISPDIFMKFKNKEGKFKEVIVKDVQGMWSLYEASHLSVPGEDILDEALDFTSTHLKSMTNQLSPSLAAQINHSLSIPLHRDVPRVYARSYMPIYEEDPSHDKTVLTMAKLDFNMLQRMHQKEIGSVTMRWNKLNIAKRVPYARDRVVEGYFWILNFSYEPMHSTGRRMMGQLFACSSLLDDTYDNYGTLEELELFTEAMKRWDISVIDSLPECMKVAFKALLELWDDIGLATAESGKSNLVLQHIKQAMIDVAQAYLVEVKWFYDDYVPTYDEYKANGVVSSGTPFMWISFLALGDFDTKEVLDWTTSNPVIMAAASLIGRLVDDMGSHKFEQERGHVASAVECCMKQYGISQEEAYKFIRKEVNELWKVVNEECLKSENIPRQQALTCLINIARTIEFMYENCEDKYTNAELKGYIIAMLVDPLSIE